MTLFLPFPSAVVANHALTPLRVVASMLQLSRKQHCLTLEGTAHKCPPQQWVLGPEDSPRPAIPTDAQQEVAVT